MPDKRSHRGRHPDDDRLFAPDWLGPLRQAVADLSWLFTRGYSLDSALKLVGDRHGLTARQRMAVRRSACSDEALEYRTRTMRAPAGCRGQLLGIDGYNLLITIESALSGGMVLVGRDGCHRDLASLHGTYRKVEETLPALALIIRCLDELEPGRVDWYLDRPVSNSGRLKTLIAETLTGNNTPWNIELHDDPDARLREYEGIVVTTDSAILDRCGQWTNLAAEIIRQHVPRAWIVDLKCPG